MGSVNGRRRIDCDEGHRVLLKHAGLLDFDAVMSRSVESPIKEVAGRQTSVLALPDGRTVYLKRYFAIPWREAVRSRLSGARREWDALLALRRLEIPTARPLVCAEERRGGVVRRAYLATLGIEHDGTLEAWMKERGAADFRERRRLVRHVGALLRRMHDGGVNHRDFYLAHLLRVGPDVAVIDLNRADVRRRVGERWRVKDLAALCSSVAPSWAARTDFARLLRAYGTSDRRFVRAIVGRATSMRDRARRKAAAGVPNFHVNE